MKNTFSQELEGSSVTMDYSEEYCVMALQNAETKETNDVVYLLNYERIGISC